MITHGTHVGARELVQGVAAVAGRHHLEPMIFQELGKPGADVVVVIDDEHATRSVRIGGGRSLFIVGRGARRRVVIRLASRRERQHGLQRLEAGRLDDVEVHRRLGTFAGRRGGCDRRSSRSGPR